MGEVDRPDSGIDAAKPAPAFGGPSKEQIAEAKAEFGTQIDQAKGTLKSIHELYRNNVGNIDQKGITNDLAVDDMSKKLEAELDEISADLDAALDAIDENFARGVNDLERQIIADVLAAAGSTETGVPDINTAVEVGMQDAAGVGKEQIRKDLTTLQHQEIQETLQAAHEAGLTEHGAFLQYTDEAGLHKVELNYDGSRGEIRILDSSGKEEFRVAIYSNGDVDMSGGRAKTEVARDLLQEPLKYIQKRIKEEKRKPGYSAQSDTPTFGEPERVKYSSSSSSSFSTGSGSVGGGFSDFEQARKEQEEKMAALRTARQTAPATAQSAEQVSDFDESLAENVPTSFSVKVPDNYEGLPVSTARDQITAAVKVEVLKQIYKGLFPDKEMSQRISGTISMPGVSPMPRAGVTDYTVTFANDAARMRSIKSVYDSNK